MSFESDRPTLLKLCWMINQGWKAELAYNRAQYKVSYYRKLKAKLETSKKPNEKWNDHLELAKKIEACRLTALKKQEQMIKARTKYRGSIAVALTKIGGRIETSYGGRINGFHLLTDDKKWREVSADQIMEMADQHDAQTALSKVLTK